MKISNTIKRKIIQIVAFGFTNSRWGNLVGGKLYTGKWKNFCAPGMNCYSCPAASFACPIGAMQAVAGSANYDISLYVIGFILAAGVILGRAICGFLCPFGLIQEVIHKIPLPKVKLPKWTTYIKYVILVVFVCILPVAVTSYMGTGKPAFCEFICPVGTLEGGIPLLTTHPELSRTLGGIFGLKLTILVAVLLGCCFTYRFFCKVICPLGAIYGLLNKISFFGLHVDEHKCTHCGACSKVCGMDVDPVAHPDSAECIRCGKCAETCPHQAIHLGWKASKKNS